MLRQQRSFDNSRPEPVARSPGYKMRRMHYRTWSPKVGRLVDTYSPSAWARQLRLEFNPEVVRYCEMFPGIDEYVNGKRLRHVFTFWVQNRGGAEELIQVIPKRELVPNAAGDLVPPRWDDITTWSAQQECSCSFIIEGTELRKHAILVENWAQILPYVQSGLERQNRELTERVHAAIRAREVLMIADLPRVFPKADPGELIEVLFVLLHAGRVRIDLTRQSLKFSMEVEPADEN